MSNTKWDNISITNGDNNMLADILRFVLIKNSYRSENIYNVHEDCY